MAYKVAVLMGSPNDGEKMAPVAETLEPGATVSGIAAPILAVISSLTTTFGSWKRWILSLRTTGVNSLERSGSLSPVSSIFSNRTATQGWPPPR